MQKLFSRKPQPTGEPKRLWLDLGDLGDLVNPAGPHEQWQDHGLGLLRTILHQNGVMTDLASTRACTSWDQVRSKLAGYDMLHHERAQLHLSGGLSLGANSSRKSTPTAWCSPAACTPRWRWTR